MGAVCPVCEKDDRIRRLASVVSGDTLRGGSDDDFVSMTSDLAEMMAPPEEPSGTTCLDIAVGVLLFPVVIAAGFASIGIGANIFGRIADSLGVQWVGWLIGGIVGFVVFLRLEIVFFRPWGRRIETRDNVLKETWRDEMAHWNKMYYCARDHIVFGPKLAKQGRPNECGSCLSQLECLYVAAGGRESCSTSVWTTTRSTGRKSAGR